MNQKGFINIIIIVSIVAIAGVAGYFVLNRQVRPIPIPNPEAPKAGPITINGEIACLPKKGAGSQTMECAIGLKGSDGRYYGLKNLFQHDPEYKFSVGGLRVEVSGIFSPEETSAPGASKYDVAGMIDVASIKEIMDRPR